MIFLNCVETSAAKHHKRDKCQRLRLEGRRKEVKEGGREGEEERERGRKEGKKEERGNIKPQKK